MCSCGITADPPFVNPGNEAQRAHDALVGLAPTGAHERCDLCPDPIKKEVAQVADADRTYTEVEHLALMADAVTRETASLTEAKADVESSLSEKAAQVDVLEAEKVALETKFSEAEKAFEDYKAELDRLAAVETAKQERVVAVKAANDSLTDSYFTDERIQRWAEMTEVAFVAFIEDITAVAATATAKETAAFSGGESPTGTTKVTAGSIFAARRGKKN